jgi:hypothetical protein
MVGPLNCGRSSSERSLVSRVFAVVPLGELRRHPFLAPDFFAGAARVFAEIAIAFVEVAIDCGLGFRDALVVAIVDDRACHPTKDRLDDV